MVVNQKATSFRRKERPVRSYYSYEDEDSFTALHFLCKRGNLTAIKSVVEEKPSLVLKPSTLRGDSCLHYAVASHNRELVQHLVQCCPEAASMRSGNNGAFGDRVTPLHVAVSTKASLEIMELLVGASQKSIRIRSGSGQSPYEMANEAYRYHRSREKVLALLQYPDMLRFNSW